MGVLATSETGQASFWSGGAAPRSRDVLYSRSLKSRCRSGFHRKYVPVVPVTTGSPRLSGSLCQSLPSDCVPLTHSPGGGSQRYRHTSGAHPATSRRRAAPVKPGLFGLPARSSEAAPVLFSVGSSRASSLTTHEAAGSLCVYSAFARWNGGGRCFSSRPCSSAVQRELDAPLGA